METIVSLRYFVNGCMSLRPISQRAPYKLSSKESQYDKKGKRSANPGNNRFILIEAQHYSA